ncbi:MAG: DMT family transporter [Amphritea sp.]|nr:DMT family transporter [Amphritea sp.]
MTPSVATTSIWTLLALLAFAGNSILCRLALGEGAIDAAGFTSLRLLSGIFTLLVILTISRPQKTATRKSQGSWSASLMLLLYAVTFSYAYLTLDTGTGALILFGAVQITMILISVIQGQRLHSSEWLGVLIAFCGFVWLVLPTLTTPSVTGFLLMSLSGIAWGLYTLKGRGSENPLGDTSFNFLRTLPAALILLALMFWQSDLFNPETGNNISTAGILLAIMSGSLASGIGYTLWYIALKGLSGTQAAVVQLSVPIIAAAGGVVFAGESIDMRLITSALLVLGGILLVILGKRYFNATKRV